MAERGADLLEQKLRALTAELARRAARVAIDGRTAMGVRFPDSAACEPGEPSPDAPAPASTSLALAQIAFRQALPAAARAAVEAQAVRTLEAAVAATRRQARALRRHWIPELGAALARLEAGLEQTEHEDAVRRTAGTGPGRSALFATGVGQKTGTEQGVDR